MTLKRRRPITLILVPAAMALLASACSSSSKSTSNTTVATTVPSGSSAGSTSGSSSILQTAQSQVSSHEGDVSFPNLPPSPTPAPGKKVFIISSDQSLEGNIRVVGGLTQAASILGWSPVVIDGKSSPDAQNAGFQQAVNQHAYAIFDVFIDSTSLGASMAAAQAAHIPVISITSGSPTSGPDAVVAEIGSVPFNYQMGQLEGYYAIAVSGGHVHAVVLKDTSFTTAPPISDGTVAVLKQCGGCTVDDVVTFGAAQIVTALPGLTQTALQQHPDVNYVFTPYDAAVSFAAQGIRDAGSSAKVVSTGGNKPNLALIRSGQTQAATVAEPLEYFSFLAVNDLIRYEGGQKPLPFDSPMKLLVTTNLPPAGATWTGDSDFVPSFKTLWGK